MTVKGSRAVNRDQITGTFERNWNNELTPVTLQMDREWDTLVDPMDIDETNDVATIANITRTFNELQKIPEMDAFLAAKIHSFVTTPDTTTLTAANILEKWDGYLAAMTDARVNRDRVEAYMTPAIYKLLKEAAGITRFVSTDEGYRGIDRNVARLDGVRITEVPSDIMKTVPVIDSCFANGYLAWGDAPELRWAANNTKLIRYGRRPGQSDDQDIGNFVYGKIEAKSRKTDPFMAFVAAMTVESEILERRTGKRLKLDVVTF
jgi:phage terminase large subunit-like protein